MRKYRDNGKRDSLIKSTVQLLITKGLEGWFLADVAAGTDVPLGNMFYYFKSKESLIWAAIATLKNSLTYQLVAESIDAYTVNHKDLRLVRLAIQIKMLQAAEKKSKIKEVTNE